jgi:hypothetical protein
MAGLLDEVRSWLRRRAGTGGGGGKGSGTGPRDVAFTLVRRRVAGLCACTCRITVPDRRWGESVRALATAIADALAEIGATVGCVGLVPDEAPVLLALAPRRDLLAARLEAALVGTGAHAYPHLWLTLARDAYLASVIHPALPDHGREPEIVALLAASRIGHALRIEVVPTGRRVRSVEFTLWAPARALRAFIASAHRALREDAR